MTTANQIITAVEGEENSYEFRIFALENADFSNVSMWHDVKLFPKKNSRQKKIVNMICEIPKCSRKKFEIATNEPGNPIKQDVKKGKLREFQKGDVYFNYGCLPRTWEDPDKVHPDAKERGDNDPLDICEIGLRIMKLAEISPVKILGCLCLIDEGEADWKLIGISIFDPWAQILNDVDDVEKHLPGTISSIREWFRTYKAYDGKEENRFALDERCMDAEYAMGIIDETHHSWLNLVSGAMPKDYDLSIVPADISVTLNPETNHFTVNNAQVASDIEVNSKEEEGRNASATSSNYLAPEVIEGSTSSGLKRNSLSFPRLSSDDLTKLIEEGA